LAKAKKGNTEAQAFVGRAYYLGEEGVTRALTLAFKFCRMAAEGGHTISQVKLGGRYARGDGVERDERKATAWYLKAAKEGGDSEAQYLTAGRYMLGVGHDAPNIKEAVKWYQAAAAQGHCGAQLQLAVCYDTGDGVYKNPGLALKLWRKCAQHVHETGNDAKDIDCIAAAHHNIGKCYFNGSTGVEVDLPLAMQWWTKAAELGCKSALYTIGQIYLMGLIGVNVPVGTFDRDVPLGMKYRRAVTVAERESDGDLQS
jgi:TPR repeat protein